MQVCVLGAGIIGLTTAYYLQQQGVHVTVIDRATAGSGASGGNGAQLSYSYVQPLADPSIWAQLPKLLFAKDSPLKFQPQLDPAQWRWGLQFMAACNAATSRANTVALLELAALSRAGFDSLLNKEKFDCDFAASAKLVLFNTEAGFAGAKQQLEYQKTLGSEQEAVSAKRCAELEPALKQYSKSIVGAIYTPSECAADCLKTCLALEAILKAHGVKFLMHTEATGARVEKGAIVAVKTDKHGEIKTDAVVLACGYQSPAIARSLGLVANLPVYPLKGYSISINTDNHVGAPQVSITDSARKVVFARLGNRLRVAGMAELVGGDATIPPDRITSLIASTRALFGECGDYSEPNPWTGFRPVTPTALPILGRHKWGPTNLHLNVGQGALGFTLSCGSAQIVTHSILGKNLDSALPINLQPFSAI
jgi:D-amino-acid dehydrogenase